MGSLLPALVGFNILWKNQLLGPAKMLAFLSLASLIALSQAAVLPAGVSAAECANYPFCGPTPVEVPGGAAILAAQKAVKHQHYLASIANPPVVPGLDVHAAALNAQLARMGVQPDSPHTWPPSPGWSSSRPRSSPSRSPWSKQGLLQLNQQNQNFVKSVQ